MDSVVFKTSGGELVLSLTAGTAFSVSLFSPVWLILEVKILLLVSAEVLSRVVVVVVSLQPSHACINLGNVIN